MLLQSQRAGPGGAVLLLILCGAPFLAALDLLLLDAFDRAWLTLAGIALAAAIVSPRAASREAVVA
jgi:hypothetical protein